MFTRPTQIPGHNGAWSRAKRDNDPNPGVPGSTFYTSRLVLWGDRVMIDDYIIPLSSGTIQGYMF